MMKTVMEIAAIVDGRIVGDGSLTVHDVAPLDQADPGHIVYIDAPHRIKGWMNSRATALLVQGHLVDQLPDDGRPRIIVSHPQEAFVKLMLHFRPPRARADVGISPHAFISPSARIGEETNIHPGVCIGDNVEIAAGCDIHPFAVIGADCTIGAGCVLHPHVVLYPDTILGDRVILHAGAVIGADGFGYRFDGQRFRHLPHTGRAVIGNEVEIGALATVDRAMVGETVIGDGTKIDNLVMIGHNCRVGRHNVFASQGGLAGSVQTGDYTRFAGQVGVADHVKIGNRCSLGAKAGLNDDVPDGQSYHGYPAGPELEQIKVHLAARRLPEMRTQFKEMQARLAELEAQLAALLASENEESVSGAPASNTIAAHKAA
jgi:UDP-3-O-[3-hydroxymyristoyl] glucosamine N-acyltransferase